MEKLRFHLSICYCVLQMIAHLELFQYIFFLNAHLEQAFSHFCSVGKSLVCRSTLSDVRVIYVLPIESVITLSSDGYYKVEPDHLIICLW